MGSCLLDLELFNKKCLLTGIDIKLSARIENGVKQLLALVTQDGNIVLHYSFGGLPPVLKHINWFTESDKSIEGISFDPTATWLLVLTSDVSLYILPALSIVDNKQRVDCKWSLTDLTCFPRHERTPNLRGTCVLWWQTLDCNQNAIIGHEDGHVSFVSLTDGQNLGVCLIGESVALMNICHDNNLDCVTLLITSPARHQWRLLIEQRSNGFIWSPEHGTKVQTTAEYAISGLANGHADEGKTSRSRLQGLKQLSVEKLASLRQKLAETRNRASNINQKVVSEDQKSTGSNDSNSSDPSIPEKLSHLCDTYLCPQFARNRHLFSGYYKPSSVLTIHGVDIDVIPMFVYKLFPDCRDILVTDRFFYIVNEEMNCLSIVSCQYSETRHDIDTEFNPESLISQFYFENEKILAIYKITDNTINNEGTDEERIKKEPKTYVLAKSEAELNIRKPKIDTCVLVTNNNVYRINLGCSVIEKFVSLVTEKLQLDKAERLATLFGLSMQQLLEYSGDLSLSQEKFTQAISLYRLSKCRILKSVLKCAEAGHCVELLSYITVCLTSTNTDMSVSTKKHLSNLAIMSYTEILLRSSNNVLQKISNFKKFINFLAYNEYYDEILAVNVICQTALWSILTVIGRIRCLAFDIIEVLCKVMQNPPQERNTSLRGLDITEDCFHNCISEPMFLQCVIAKPQFSKMFLGYIRDNLNHFSITSLKRLSNALDPSHPVAWSIVSRVLQKHRCSSQSSSLDSTLDSMESEPPDELLQSTQDFIETFICILIVLIHKMENDKFDVELLNIVEAKRDLEDLPNCSTLLYPKPRPMSAGFGHVGLIRNNTLFMWGGTNSGCLGLGPMVTKYSLPQQVELLNSLQLEIISVSCGRNHSIVLSNYGVYSMGSNVYGQLGLSRIVYQAPYPTLIECLSSENIVDVSAGQYHNLVLTSSGQVYSWGWGVFGQLGHGNTHDVFKPKKIEFFKDKVVVQISAGHAHSVVLTREGVVYCFGSNNFGQLGNGTSTKSSSPVQILLNEKISQITTSYFHNLAITTENKIYHWGASPQHLRHQVHNYKREKITKQNDKNSEQVSIDWATTTPFSIDNKHLFPAMLDTEHIPGHIIQISTGCNHSALVTKDGSLYLWGQNFEGQLGNGSRVEVLTPTLVKINPLAILSPQNVSSLSSDSEIPLKCSFVSCGAEYTVAIDFSGRVLAWGSNSKAQLGKISEEDERGLEGKMVMLKTTKRILKIPKSCQNITDLPKEVPNIPAMHITYRNYDKYLFINKNLSYLFPLKKIENNFIKIEIENESSYLNRTLGFIHDKEIQNLYLYGQKTLHYVLQTYFGFYDTELILQKCVEFNNFQGASKISYLDGHFSDSLGFQLNSFKTHMGSQKWAPCPKLPEPIKIIKNSVSIISNSCSLESIKNFQDDTESQGGYESLYEEVSFIKTLPTEDSDTDLARNQVISLLQNPDFQQGAKDVSLDLSPQHISENIQNFDPNTVSDILEEKNPENKLNPQNTSGDSLNSSEKKLLQNFSDTENLVSQNLSENHPGLLSDTEKNVSLVLSPQNVSGDNLNTEQNVLSKNLSEQNVELCKHLSEQNCKEITDNLQRSPHNLSEQNSNGSRVNLLQTQNLSERNSNEIGVDLERSTQNSSEQNCNESRVNLLPNQNLSEQNFNEIKVNLQRSPQNISEQNSNESRVNLLQTQNLSEQNSNEIRMNLEQSPQNLSEQNSNESEIFQRTQNLSEQNCNEIKVNLQQSPQNVSEQNSNESVLQATQNVSEQNCDEINLQSEQITKNISPTNFLDEAQSDKNSETNISEKYSDANLSDVGAPIQTDLSGFSNEIIRKTVTNYVESLDPEVINSDRALIPNFSLQNLNRIYTESALQNDRFRIEQKIEKSERIVENPDVIDQASKIVEFYCSRPQITENHILMQNILIKVMQFWLSNNLPVDILETILLKNMDRYFFPLSILLFCKNFNNNLGEGMIKDGESTKSQKSFEFLKKLSTKFCLQLCSMVLQNVNKA